MPTYEYLCKTCGKSFETVQSMKDDALTHCLVDVCQADDPGNGIVERQISYGGGVIYKGGGFYHTDYVRKKSDGDDGPPASSGSGEAS